jgi:hypothetical protein
MQRVGHASCEDDQRMRQAGGRVFDHFDTDGDGVLSPTEMEGLHLALSSEDALAAQNVHSSSLSPDQCRALLKHNWTRRQKQTAAAQSKKSDDDEEEEEEEATDENLLRLCAKLQSEGVLAADTTISWDTSEDAVDKQEAVAIRCVGFLFLSYSVDEWYFDLVEQFRKLLMTSVIVFLMSQPAAQLAVGIIITFLALLLNVRRIPFVIRPLNNLQAACLTVQVITLFYGMLVLFDKLYNDATTLAFFMLNALMPAAALANILLSALRNSGGSGRRSRLFWSRRRSSTVIIARRSMSLSQSSSEQQQLPPEQQQHEVQKHDVAQC